MSIKEKDVTFEMIFSSLYMLREISNKSYELCFEGNDHVILYDHDNNPLKLVQVFSTLNNLDKNYPSFKEKIYIYLNNLAKKIFNEKMKKIEAELNDIEAKKHELERLGSKIDLSF